MIDELLERDDMPPEKINRWLGFIQGVMWTYGMFSIDDLRVHSRAL
jgi:hypothetical protein